MSLAKSFDAFYRPLREDIFKFSHAMGVDPTDQQAEAMTLVQRRYKRIGIKSGKGTGKTKFSGIVGLWRAFRHVGALTYVTAPTMHQCKDVWLTEAARIVQGARYPVLRRLFECTKSRVIIGGRDAWGVRLVTASKPDAIAGIHEDHLSFIAEEAAGIGDPIFDQIESTLTNEDSLLLAIGNPTVRECRFFTFFNSAKHKWATLTLNSEESSIVDKGQIAHIEETYGKDSDVYRTQVLGEFPNMDPNCIMSSEDLEKCTKTDFYQMLKVPRLRNGVWSPAKQFGLDFARFGGDENIIAQRSGNALVALKYYPYTEPKHVIKQAFRMQSDSYWKNDETWYCADANGLGDAVMIDIKDAGKSLHEFKAQHKAKSGEFANKTTEAWFLMARKVKAHKVWLPNDRMLLQQLSTRQYRIKPDGKIAIEKKEDYVLRTGLPSPDRADGCCMAFYDQVEANTQTSNQFSAQWRDPLALRKMQNG